MSKRKQAGLLGALIMFISWAVIALGFTIGNLIWEYTEDIKIITWNIMTIALPVVVLLGSTYNPER